MAFNFGYIGLALQAAGMLSQYKATKDNNNQNRAYQLNSIDSILSNYAQQTKTLKNRYNEEIASTAKELEDAQLENMRNKATAQASAASSGVQGGSLDLLFRDYDRAAATNNYVAATNINNMTGQYADELDNLRYRAISSLYGIQDNSKSTGSLLLSGAGGLLSEYSRMKRNDWTYTR